MATTCVLGHAWREGQVLCPTCGFGLRNLPAAAAAEPRRVAIVAQARAAEAQVPAAVAAPVLVTAGPAAPPAERILSPDGYWAWDGDAWVPAEEQPAAAAPEPAAAVTTELPPVEVTTPLAAEEPDETPAQSGGAAEPPVSEVEAEVSHAEVAHAEVEVEAGHTVVSQAEVREAEVREAEVGQTDIVDEHEDAAADGADEADSHDLPTQRRRVNHNVLLSGLVVLTAMVSSDIAFSLPPLGR